MTRTLPLWALLPFLSLPTLGCGEKEPGTPVKNASAPKESKDKAPDPTTTRTPLPEIHPQPSVARAEGIAATWLQAAKKRDGAALESLFAEDARGKAEADPKAWTRRVASGEVTVESLRIFPGFGEGDDATVSTRVTFKTAAGATAENRLVFELVRKDGRWWIARLESMER